MPTEIKYVLRISKPNLGKNVEDCNDDELVFNSEREVLKVPLNGVGVSTTGSVVNHALGYIPAYLICRKFTKDGHSRAMIAGSDTGASCDENNLYMDDYYSSRSFKYYFFYKQGA